MIIIMYRTANFVHQQKLKQYEKIIINYNMGEHIIDELDKENSYSILRG